MRTIISTLLLTCLWSTLLYGQTAPQTPFDNKFHWGGSFNMYWTTVQGDQPAQTYFTKPSVGFNVRAEYYFNSFVGVGLGFGYQQRGMGVLHSDIINTPGNPDSTYSERVRFNTFELPISLLLRTPKDIVPGIRLSVSLSLVPVKTFSANDVFHSPSDGNHVVTSVDNQYAASDLLTQFSIGPEIDSGGTGLFQIHLVYCQGSTNVYAQQQGNALNHSIGIRVAWLFK